MTTPGLRERKKAKTLRAIQDQALRLVAEQGYNATTVEQIAEAAEVSPSTFFRYFPTKEDAIVADEYDPVIIEAIVAQPSDLTPMQAVRRTFAELFPPFLEDDSERVLTRAKLIFEVPALRNRALSNVLVTQRLICEAVATRLGREPEDMQIQQFAGAVIGVLTPVLIAWVESGGATPLWRLVDDAMAHLEAGLPL
ncbi:MAG: TetR family transcriptional regulator [Stackebrandtia sp.]